MGAGRTRFWVGPWFAKHALTTRSSSSSRRFWFLSATCTAFAIAERSVFSMSRATPFFVKRRMLRASAAFFPRMRSRTSPAFWAEVLTYLAVAFTSRLAIVRSLALARGPGGGRSRGSGRARRPGGARDLRHLLDARGVALELPRGRELAELVPDHVLRDVDGDELLAVVDGQRVPHHLGEDRRAARPRLDDLAVVGRVHGLDLLDEVLVDEGALLERSCHGYLRLLMMKPWVRLLLRVLAPFVGLPQGVTGWRPPEVLPSPPPWGWSTGFMTTPRLWGFRPSQRFRPALPWET